jgi:type II secretion system protein N
VSGFKQKLLMVLRYSLYPLFYLFCLLSFFYLTFPWDRLRERAIAEFEATQATKGSEAQRLEIGSLSGFWITGVEIENAKLIVPPTAAEIAAADLAARRAEEEAANPDPSSDGSGSAESGEPAADADDDASKTGDEAEGGKAKKAEAPKKKATPRGPRETVLLVERATARVQILPLLLGRVQVAVHVEAFGGEVNGSIPVRGKGDFEVALENVDLGQIGIIRNYLTVPARGIATGELTLSRGENGKLAKSTGSLNLVIEDAVLGDGKTKIANLITLPAAKLGKVEIAAEAEGGALKISKFGAAGGDLELSAEGQVKLKEKWKSSALDLFLRFKFTDEFRMRDDKTKVIFGEPGSRIPGLIDSQPKIKRAKRGDDSYGIHFFGSLKSPKYEPWTSDEASTPGAKKKDTAAADDDDDDDEGSAPAGNDPFRRNRSRDRTTPPPTPPTSPRPATPSSRNAAPSPLSEPDRPGRRSADREEPAAPPADQPPLQNPMQMLQEQNAIEEPSPEQPPVEDAPLDEQPPQDLPPEEAPPP